MLDFPQIYQVYIDLLEKLVLKTATIYRLHPHDLYEKPDHAN